MKRLNRRAVTLGGAAVVAAPLAAPVLAQRLSDKPITIVVPFSPGSGPDILARITGEELRARWGQPVIIDNRAGASGNIGANFASKAAPDGHTLLLYVNTVLLNAALLKNLPFDPVKGFEPIVEIARGSLALAVHKSVAAADAKALVAAAIANPDSITYASPGRGTPHHFAMELFKLRTGANLRHVPFQGTAGAVTAFIGGHVNAMFIPIHVGLSHAKDGNIRLLGVGSAARSPLAKDVPTMTEQGIANAEVDLWYGLSAPAGTPRDIVERFNSVINQILADPKVKVQLEKQGLATSGGTSRAFTDLIAGDLPRWSDVVQRAGLKADE